MTAGRITTTFPVLGDLTGLPLAGAQHQAGQPKAPKSHGDERTGFRDGGRRGMGWSGRSQKEAGSKNFLLPA